MYLVTLILTWASSGPSDSGPHLGFTWIWRLWSPPGLYLDLVTVVPPGPHMDELTVSHSDLTWTWRLRSSYGHHGTWVLSSTSGPHFDLVILGPSGPHPDVVTLVPTWISPEPGDSGPHLGLNRTWGHCSSTGPQQDLVNLLLT